MDNKAIGQIIVAIIVVNIGAIVVSIKTNINRLRKDIRRINMTLEKIAKQIGVPDTSTDDIDTQLKRLIAVGEKIEAIKKYRMVTGLNLRECKKYVDNLVKDYNN